MPIIEISALPPTDGIDIPSALGHVTSRVAAYLGEEPRGTWAIWRPVAPGAYAEGADAPVTQPRATHPAIVDVFAGDRDDVSGLLREVGWGVPSWTPSASTTATSWSASRRRSPGACTGATEPRHCPRELTGPPRADRAIDRGPVASRPNPRTDAQEDPMPVPPTSQTSRRSGACP